MTSKPHFELAILKENVETKRITFKNQEFESLAEETNLLEKDKNHSEKQENNCFLDFFQPRKIFKNQSFYAILALILSLTLYLITLRGCSSNVESTCVGQMLPLIPKFCFLMFVSAFIIDFTIYLIIKKVLSKKFFFLLAGMFLIISIVSRGTTFQKHGRYNQLILIVFAIFEISIIVIIDRLHKCAKKRPFLVIGLVSLILLSSFIYIYFFWIKKSCHGWKRGLNDSALDNNIHCRLPKPSICFHDMTNNWFDLSRLLGKEDCSKILADVSLSSTDSELIAYPKTQFFSRWQKYNENYQDEILNNVKTITREERLKGQFDVVLDQTDLKNPKIDIQIFRNETLIKRSVENLAKIQNTPQKKPLVKNILSIYIDALSRQHFRRKLKKTWAFLEKFYRNSESNAETFQFFRYHATGGFTTPNMMKGFYGTIYSNAKDGVPFSRVAKNQGFITGRTSNFCSSTYFEIGKEDEDLFDLDLESFDHENTALACDPNYQRRGVDGPYGYLGGSYAMVKRCLYGKEIGTYNFEYGKKFWETYSDQNKYLEMIFQEAHEPSAELIQYLDDPLTNFLTWFESIGGFEDTMVVFMSDHGHHVNIFYYLFDLKDLEYELKLPMFFLIMPKKLDAQFRENLIKNEQVLLSAEEIYNLLMVAAGQGEKISKNNDVMRNSYKEQKRCYRDVNIEEKFSICDCGEK